MSAIPSDHVLSDSTYGPPARPLSIARGGARHEVVEKLLSDVCHSLAASSQPRDVSTAMDALFFGLQDLKLRLSASEWSDAILCCRRHALRELVHEDPFTHRAYSKPRGYAGDAVMMDYIYGREELWPSPAASRLGQWIFDYTTTAPASAGVLARRGFIADVLDRVTQEQNWPHILSVACGHMREANLSSSIKRRRFQRFIALDSDEKSLDEVHRSYGAYGVETVTARIAKLMAKRIDLGAFDLIYSLGLYDYLGQPLAQRLTTSLFELLRPGGRLVLANFLPNVRDIGYMEAFMDWQLVYRTRHEMIDMTMEIPQAEIDSIRLSAEENQNIIFLEVRRA